MFPPILENAVLNSSTSFSLQATSLVIQAELSPTATDETPKCFVDWIMAPKAYILHDETLPPPHISLPTDPSSETTWKANI